MTTPKGGRGIRAEYPTKVARIPDGLSDTVQMMSDCYKASGTDVLEAIVSAIASMRHEQKATRDWTKFSQFISDIESSLPAGYIDHMIRTIESRQ